MLVLAHRGASADAPENTPAAFRLADTQGADGVELDVRRAADGRLLAAHDPLPTEPSELERAAFASLDEVLDACGDRMLVNVEIKNWRDDPDHDPTLRIVPPVLDELRRRGRPERWLISSFSWETIEACRAQAPEIATAWLCLAADHEAIARVAAAGHAALHPHERSVDTALVEQVHAEGLALNVWTCNDRDRIAELAGFGVDGVCTDVPAVALDALDRSGAALSPVFRRVPR